MKIFTAKQIRDADQYTIDNEPIGSIDLMERAANKCFEWIAKHYEISKVFYVFCGTGNNGGDGLAICRMLAQADYACHCFEVVLSATPSADYQINRSQLKLPVASIQKMEDIPDIQNAVIIDALLGSGLNKVSTGIVLKIIKVINKSQCEVISIDIPSGLFSEFNHKNPMEGIVQATHTLTFQAPKLSFMLPEQGNTVGVFHILDIDLHPEILSRTPTPYQYLTKQTVILLLKSVSKFSHKGTFGHLLLIAGKEGSMGAAILAANAALYSGVGKLTVFVPKCGVDIIQAAVPEAMLHISDGEKSIEGSYELNFEHIAIGPGLGTNKLTATFLKQLLKKVKHPLIVDADALNLLAENPNLFSLLPPYSILTPHPKEFQRMVADWDSNQQKLGLLQSFTKKHQCICILKGAHTAIGFPEGNIYFNSTGNPGMATAGSGDVLTGILGSLLAQGYAPKATALIGVYLHGLAGDIAQQEFGIHAMTAGNIQKAISEAYKSIYFGV